jgi:prevent-host-death family protein
MVHVDDRRGATMARTVSKSQFKPRALEYFRQVEETGAALVITDRGRPVLRILRYDDDPAASLKLLRNTVVKYDDPTEPVDDEEWEAAR